VSAKPIRLLANAVDVVDILAEKGPMTPAQIAEIAGIPRSSVYRLVEGLNEINFTETREDSTVTLSKRWLHLADSSRAGMREWAAAGPVLSMVAETTGQTSFLTVPRGDEGVCIDWSMGRGIGLLALKPGRSLPLYVGAAGRVILAYGSEDRYDYLQRAPFPELTPKTLVTAEELRADIETTLRQRYVFSDEDVTIGIAAIGVPLFSAEDEFRGCLSIGGLADELSARAQEHLAVLQRGAAQLSGSE
jgi:IclR family acetate operon transcriptional repressor